MTRDFRGQLLKELQGILEQVSGDLRQPPVPRLWSLLCRSGQMLQSRLNLQRDTEGLQ